MISRRDGVFCYTDIESFNNHIIRSNLVTRYIFPIL